MGGTAEELAKRHGISRAEVDAFASRCFDRALAARAAGFFDDEIVPVVTETFNRDRPADRGIALSRKIDSVTADTHPRPSPVETLAKIRPAFGGVQTGGNSSAVVDGAAAAVVASGAQATGRKPLARLVAACAVGCPPEIMGIGPVPAIRALLDRAGLTLARRRAGRDQRGLRRAGHGLRPRARPRRGEAQRQWRRDRHRPSARRHRRPAVRHLRARAAAGAAARYGIASACIGGGQGIALLLENTDA